MQPELIWSLTFAIPAMVLLPLGYFILCRRMHRSRVARPPYASFLIVFVCYAGLLLSIALNPSLPPPATLISELFSLVAAPLASLSCVAGLWGRKDFSHYHRAAFWTAMLYPGVIVGLLLVGSLFFDINRSGFY